MRGVGGHSRERCGGRGGIAEKSDSAVSFLGGLVIPRTYTNRPARVAFAVDGSVNAIIVGDMSKTELKALGYSVRFVDSAPGVARGWYAILAGVLVRGAYGDAETA
jgi:hypothetical protein